jgi:hypothetical protein
MRERAVRFGEEGGLVGVLAEPDGEAAPARPAVLLHNVGFGHRVGPHRLNVELSRELAARGFVSLRFDLSGQGDSDPRLAPTQPLERASADLADAMSFVARRRSLDRFALVSMCSGTEVGHAVTVRDPRVAAAAFIDGFAYPTLGYRLRNAIARLRKPRTWIPGILRVIRRTPPEAKTIGGEFFERHYVTADAFRRDVLAVSSRNAFLLFVFSYRWWFFNHLGQFAAMLGLRRLPPRLEVEYWTDADHMFTSVCVRQRLVSRLVKWLEAAFPDEHSS